MTGKPELARLRALLSLAELRAQNSAADLRKKRAREDQLAGRIKALDPLQVAQDTYDHFAASGAAQSWRRWQQQERRRLGILAARARLAADAARRTHAQAEARRQVLQRLCKER